MLTFLLAAMVGRLSALQTHPELEKVLREKFSLDLNGAGELLAPPPSANEPYEAINAALRKAPTTTSGSGSSNSDRFSERRLRADFRDGTTFSLTLQHDGQTGRQELDLKAGSRRLRVSHTPRESLTVTVEDDGRDAWAIYAYRRGKSSRLLWTEKDQSFSRVWPATRDGFRTDPPEVERMLLALLRTFPISLSVTPADREVADVCLRWGDAPTEERAGDLKRLRDRLEDNDPQVRAEAIADLKRRAAKEPDILRWVLASLDKAQDAEVVANLQDVIASQKSMVTALKLVTSEKLYRDLPYVAAHLAHPERSIADGARKRMEKLVGRSFESRADFDAWYADHREKLTWDEASGRYRP